MSDVVTVAIPVRDGAATLEPTLAAVQAQQLSPGLSLELIVCDSGSRDGSVALARSYGADVIEIHPEGFSHGGTRNLLMQSSHGTYVAFLTQDAVPADELWLARLVDGFALALDVGLAFGPYRARQDASPMVGRELTDWFRSLSQDGLPRIHRLGSHERDMPALELRGATGFFTDANGCVARAAWERVPFRDVAYAEDHLLAQDMMRAGFAKVYLPDAAVIHSHDYSPGQWMRRSFDEARAVRDVYGWRAAPRVVARNLQGNVMADWRWVRRTSTVSSRKQASVLAASLVHHGARATGELLGSRADRLPRPLAARLSLEGRH